MVHRRLMLMVLGGIVLAGVVSEFFYFMGYRGGLYGFLLSERYDRWWVNVGSYGDILCRQGYGSLSLRGVGVSFRLPVDSWYGPFAGYFWVFDNELTDVLRALGGTLDIFGGVGGGGKWGVRIALEVVSVLFREGFFCWVGSGISFHFDFDGGAWLRGCFADGVVSDLRFRRRGGNYLPLNGLDSLDAVGYGDVVNVQVLRGVMNYLNM